MKAGNSDDTLNDFLHHTDTTEREGGKKRRGEPQLKDGETLRTVKQVNEEKEQGRGENTRQKEVKGEKRRRRKRR